MKVPLIKPDLPSFDTLAGPFAEILGNGRITNFGRYMTAFEQAAGEYLGTHVATTSSGTAGLILTLQMLSLPPGSRVVIPSFTFMATAQAVLYAGAIPLFAEVEDDLNLSPSDLDRLLTEHDDVSAVIPVHMYGLPARVDEIRDVVDRAQQRRGRPLHLLYDAAHGFGSALGGRRVGGFGDAEIFSLSVTKVLVSVEGGMVSSHDEKLIGTIKKMRNYGIEASYDAHWMGLNSKMSEFHAIVGLKNLERLDELMRQRQQKARRYQELLRQHTRFDITAWPASVTHTFKDFTIMLPESLAPRREAIMAQLLERGIETRAYFYPPVHEQTYFRRFADRPLPRTEALSRRVLTLPFFTTITDAEMETVVTTLAEIDRRLQP
jgi:dTDP-4-amino-4,6-dideoxygalactose transaminase